MLGAVAESLVETPGLGVVAEFLWWRPWPGPRKGANTGAWGRLTTAAKSVVMTGSGALLPEVAGTTRYVTSTTEPGRM